MDADQEVASKKERQQKDQPHVHAVGGEPPNGFQEVKDKDDDFDDDPGGEKGGLANSGAVDEEAAGYKVKGGQNYSQHHHHKCQEQNSTQDL